MILFIFLSSSAPEMLDPKANMKREHFSWASKIPSAPVLIDSSSVRSYAKIQEKQNSSCINKSASDHRYQMCVHQALLHWCPSLCCSFFCVAVLCGMFFNQQSLLFNFHARSSVSLKVFYAIYFSVVLFNSYYLFVIVVPWC